MTEQLLGNKGAFLIAFGIVIILIGVVCLLIAGIGKKKHWRSETADTFCISGWTAIIFGAVFLTIYTGTIALGNYLTQFIQ